MAKDPNFPNCIDGCIIAIPGHGDGRPHDFCLLEHDPGAAEYTGPRKASSPTPVAPTVWTSFDVAELVDDIAWIVELDGGSAELVERIRALAPQHG